MSNVNEACTFMTAAATLLEDLKKLSAGLHNLANDQASDSIEVNKYLKQGQIGIGIVE